MINTSATVTPHDHPFPFTTVESVIAPEDIRRLNAELPSLDLFTRLVREEPERPKRYRMWLYELYEHGARAPRTDELPPAWGELLDTLLTPAFGEFVSDTVGLDVRGLDLTLGIYRYFGGDYTTVDTGKASKAVHWALYLNEDWTEEDGGAMHLWTDREAPEPAVAVVPRGGTSGVFRPSPVSWHNIDLIRATDRDRINIMVEYWHR